MTDQRALPLTPAWRVAIGVSAAANLAAAVVVATRQQAVMDAWPWELTRLSVLFLAAMLAAVGAAAAWIAASGEGGALPAGFVNLAVTGGGIAGWLLVSGEGSGVAVAAIGLLAAGNLAAALVTHRAVRRRAPAGGWPRPPAVVRWSFVAYALVLAAVGIALVAGATGVMPWQVGPGTAEVFGWIFLGDACFFAYALAWPNADQGRSQLWSFLGYDAVLLVPLARTLPNVDASVLPNLVVYLAVLVQSAVLGVWFLSRRRPAR